MTIQEWLDTPPPDEDIRIKDGGKYIPYHIIVDYLNYLSPSWDACNFSHIYYTLKNGKTIVSGSVDVFVTFYLKADSKIERRLSGAATFALSKSSNPHPAASVKSLAIMNAVKPLGKRFGWGLNGFETESVYFPDEDAPDVFTDTEIAAKEFEEKASKCMTIEELAQLKVGMQPYQQAIYAKHLRRLTKNITQ